MTLRSALNRMMLVAFGLVLVIGVGLLFGYAQIKQTLARKAVEESLQQQAIAQVEALLPSILVPEQRAGIAVLLERFKEQEGLQTAQLIQDLQELPSEFASCTSTTHEQICLSRDGNRIASLTPVGETGQGFGYLLKVIAMPNPLATDSLLQVIEVTTVVLLLSFLCIFMVLTRVATQEIPKELDNLGVWVEAVLNEKSNTQQPQLRFAELNALGAQIAEIIERHQRARDQAVVGQVASGIMHDIKTPLHSVVTAMELAREQAPDSPRRAARLDNLLKVCLHHIPLMGEIIESTLDGSREVHVDPMPADLNATLTRAIQTHSTLIKQKRVTIETQAGAASLWVEHDPVQLGRVFSNIIKNAVEAIPTGQIGKIQIDTTIREGQGVTVSIEDSGPGLPANPEAVFRAFRSSKVRGTGLGLLVSRKIIKAHRGELRAKQGDRLGGARFEIVLQQAQAEGMARI